MRATHTYVVLPVSQSTFDEIKRKLVTAEYRHALLNDGETIDMHGIALEVDEDEE